MQIFDRVIIFLMVKLMEKIFHISSKFRLFSLRPLSPSLFQNLLNTITRKVAYFSMTPVLLFLYTNHSLEFIRSHLEDGQSVARIPRDVQPHERDFIQWQPSGGFFTR